ncbi:peptidoglycan-binding protein [Bifidobacterium tissieri]|uniref:Peptidoglycan-binding protein n=1 Tax=Bifidobacterium tissieri TaxID=1630162 RepID=A0A261FIM5_9BIFI|nr:MULTISPECIES: glycoside hydrolase domain-containing protein [Bifidobacterium]OZG58843.1 peptidoglycan-binding protein [Bifidobacterium tissieri]
MSDPMVLKTQHWLNNTYGGDSRYNRIIEDGNTGWNTINALIRALQIELGLSSTADNFGDETKKAYSKAPLQMTTGETNNKFAILQGALWCKGYNPGHAGTDDAIDNRFDAPVAAAVKELKSDAGLINPNSIVTTNFMKALLSMDQFKLLSSYGGKPAIRSYQQKINQRYEDYTGIIPCDGVYTRSTNHAAILALQAMEGMPLSKANGYVGNQTKLHCPNLPYAGAQTNYTGRAYTPSEIASFTELLNFYLYVNGYGDGNLALSLSPANIMAFQKHCALPQTGKADLSTWLSLLVSYGDQTREAHACDTRFEITARNLMILKMNHYQNVGRYIIGGDFKELRTGEPEKIIAGGLHFFPIYQDVGRDASAFTSTRGASDAASAMTAASKHSIPQGSVIYFAVDYDALDTDVTRNILPYFRAVKNNLTGYRVGIYGARNVCQRVIDQGYAQQCFVSDMSSGFSGNMGYRLPDNWAYDQIANLHVSYDGKELEIDKVVSSGLDVGVKDTVRSQDYIAPDPLTSTDPWECCINTYEDRIPIHSEPNLQSAVIGFIPTNSFYYRNGNMAGRPPYENLSNTPDNTHEVRFLNGLGNVSTGYYCGSTTIGSTILEPWYNAQKPFIALNSTGSTLEDADTRTEVIYGNRMRVFTLQRNLDWGTGWEDNAGRHTWRQGVLPVGTKVAIPAKRNDESDMRMWRNYLPVVYWGDASGWATFPTNESFSPKADTILIDAGLQYGDSPSTRALW